MTARFQRPLADQIALADDHTVIEDMPAFTLHWDVSEQYDTGLLCRRPERLSRTATLIGATFGELHISAADVALVMDANEIERQRAFVEETGE